MRSSATSAARYSNGSRKSITLKTQCLQPRSKVASDKTKVALNKRSLSQA
jgi:hypothetical protein